MLMSKLFTLGEKDLRECGPICRLLLGLYTFIRILSDYLAQTSQKNRRTMRSTMSTFKSRQSTAGGLATRASIGVRYSMGGKASIGPDSTIKTDKRKLHTNKDPRKLNEKA